MRLILIVWACLALAACVAGPVGNREVPEPAKAVDLQRYLGRWYEFARYENAFEKDCEAVTAEYALRPDGKVSVRNSCHEATIRGPLKVSEGVALPAGDRLGAKFKVSFFGPALLTNYWVLDRADDYGWAIVGEGSGRFLWLLTRDPRPSQAVREAMLARVERLGYDTHMLRYTQHLRTGP